MTRFVLDASVALAWCFPDESSPQAKSASDRVVSGERPLVSSFWWYEVTNALLQAERKGRITPAVADSFLVELGSIRVIADRSPDEASLQAIQTICRKHSLTAYDAAYLQLATRERCPLATLDSDLKRAAAAENVQLL